MTAHASPQPLGIRVVRIDETRDRIIHYVAWRLDVSLLLRRLKAIGGIGTGTSYLWDVLGTDQDILDDHPLTRAGVRYLRMKKLLRREVTRG